MEDAVDAVRGRMSGMMAGCPGRAGCPGWSGRMSGLGIRRTPRGEVKSRAKVGRFCGWKLGKRWGKARYTCNTRNPRIKSNKTSSHKQITKKIGAILWGNFRVRTKNNKIKLENKERGLRNRDQRGSWYQDDVGWNPRWPIFHERSGSQLRT